MNLNMIISFDVTNEKFETIDLPDSLACHNIMDLHISKIRDSLAMLQERENIYTVWMMEHSVQRPFTQLFSIETRHHIVGFRESGIPILQVTDNHHDDYEVKYEIVVYEPNLEHDNVLETSVSCCCFEMHSYMETLLLLGRPRWKSY